MEIPRRSPTSAAASLSPAPVSLEFARRLLARKAAEPGERKPKDDVAVLQGACMEVFENLSDAMGEAGANALLARALARTEEDHPALKHISRGNHGGIKPEAVVASIEANGIAPVRAAVEALIAALVDVLARLIGEDMAIRLIDPEDPRHRSPHGDGAHGGTP